MIKKIFFTLLLTTVFFNVSAQTCSGKWTTIDDETGKKKSIVELYKSDGKLYGKITYLYPREGREENPKCTKCEDDRKNKPLVGLQIVRGCKWDGTEWEGGTIVDPENGKVYSVKIWMDENNPNKLNVRGYIGIFFRTQTWQRVVD
ncbi:MAG: DUF2147 domain-containing protein [Crocinitomicaceae bacterium]|jgi:uncharacterized protein (DUF2147 family)|nr:DUF2147 domain-containing protein [Crocinitomicaceae bacterium]MDP4683858.1 DUF2147 domain-containing protein [Crocinitomicaceae bacterium]MDP4865851.1 DUF2147 domain-containing protein [Crocinitomicaceae bacterium]MDP5011048.1 DUF2147 domain-containing protein [Crocinitomicaceae bacterium]MDP5099562.1 DUF2147 domain-containing protein [Crocinitomicaceae bacterium]